MLTFQCCRLRSIVDHGRCTLPRVTYVATLFSHHAPCPATALSPRTRRTRATHLPPPRARYAPPHAPHAARATRTPLPARTCLPRLRTVLAHHARAPAAARTRTPAAWLPYLYSAPSPLVYALRQQPCVAFAAAARAAACLTTRHTALQPTHAPPRARHTARISLLLLPFTASIPFTRRAPLPACYAGPFCPVISSFFFLFFWFLLTFPVLRILGPVTGWLYHAVILTRLIAFF